MTAAAPERLHLLAHRAVISGRDIDDWWANPLTTALSAAALAKHSQALHDTAAAAVSRLQRWVDAGEPRNTTDDTVALSLLARAAADLQRRDPRQLERAAAMLKAQLSRPRLRFPDLHLALCAWAFDELVVDRHAAPWPALRMWLDQLPSPRGVDASLRAYVSGIAADRFDPPGFARAVIATVGQSPGVIDGAVLTWVLTAAVDKLAEQVPSTDVALSLLVERRASIVESLATVLDDSSFREPQADLPAADTWNTPYLTVFEAALLDSALAPRDPAVAWLTEKESIAMFGEQAEAWRDRQRRTSSSLLRTIAGLMVVLSVVVGTLLWQTLTAVLHVSGSLPLVSAGATLAAGVAAGTWLLQRDPSRWRFATRARAFATTFAVLMATLVVNLALPQPVVSDVGGLIGSTLLSLVAALVTPVEDRAETR